MKQVKWFNRSFDFKTEQNIFPSVVERLRGTPVRLEEKLKKILPGLLTLRVEGTWTIKENAGHLIDLEPLWLARLDDIIDGKEELRAADLQNTQTSLAKHDLVPTMELLDRFRKIREETVHRLEMLDEELVFRSALHPRLKTPMRTMDLFLFVAEHDDHHLARITELAKLIAQQK